MQKNNISLLNDSAGELSKIKKNTNSQKKYKHGNAVIVFTFIGLILLYVYSISLFVPLKNIHSFAYWISMSGDKFAAFLSYIGGNSSAEYNGALISKYTVILLAGAGLSAAGVVFQGSFRNIIASPTTMGVQSGAGLGNALYLLICTQSISGFMATRSDDSYIQNASFLELNKQQFFAVFCGLLSILIVVALISAMGRGKFTSSNILFEGLVFSSFVDAVTSIIRYYFLYNDADNSRVASMRTFSLGNFDRITSFQQLFFIAAVCIPCMIILILASSKLNVLVLGEEEAMTMGLNVKVLKVLMVFVGTLLSVTIFAFCGKIGFMGFIVPQICRRLAGPDFKRLVVFSMAMGGLLMIIIYNVAAILDLTTFLNIITSVIGCTMMLYALLKGKDVRAYV